MTEVQEQNGRTKITLPLSESERAGISRAFKARDTALDEYERAYDAARDALSDARRAAHAAYGTECGTAYAAYLKASVAAHARYNEASDAAWAKCARACNAAFADCGSELAGWVWRAYGEDYTCQAIDVLNALAEGANLNELREMAEEQHWCGVWDEALRVAMERFDLEARR